MATKHLGNRTSLTILAVVFATGGCVLLAMAIVTRSAAYGLAGFGNIMMATVFGSWAVKTTKAADSTQRSGEAANGE